MKIDEIMAVSGMPGLYKIGAARNTGMIVEEIDSGKSKFLSVRKHQFTPLATVAIYTNADSTEINDVFETMAAQADTNPIPPVKSPADVLFTYFEKILPDYDKERVLVSDVKKVIKWYNFLTSRQLFPFEVDDQSVEGEEE